MTPLDGRTILDCSTLLPGPFLGKLLALQGARVIKIENPKRPDPARAMGDYYADLNECKELRSLDLTAAADREQFKQLVREADGLIEGFRPNAKKKLGLDEESLHAINSKLCILSLVGYRENGPRRDRAGHDLNFQALTGALSLTSEMPALPLADLFSAYYGAFALTAALDSVARGVSLGVRVVISMSEIMLLTQSVLFRDYRKTGVIPRPGETLFSGAFPCYRLYSTADGRRVAVGAIEAKFWKLFCVIIGADDKLTNNAYSTGDEAVETVRVIQAIFGSKPWSHWAPLFEKADCCVEPVLDYSEVSESGL